MKIYHVDSLAYKTKHLETFYDYKTKTRKIKDCYLDKNIFLDSGAYSAFTKNIKIDIDEYIDFIKNNKDLIEAYSVLDDIKNPEITLSNQKIMEGNGLNPLPCYHYGEDINYLNYYINNYDYMSIGGMVPVKNSILKPWLDNLFSKYICDKEGYPKVKIHGFGTTSHSFIFRYPWYSVDSKTAIITSRYGDIIFPKINSEVFNYNFIYRKTVSEKSYNQLTYNEIRKIKHYLSKIGFDYDRSCNDYKERDRINIQYYMDLEKYIPEYPRKFEVKRRGFKI